MDELSKLTTEMRNERTMHIDRMSTSDILTAINNEDMTVAHRVQQVLPEIEKAVDIVCSALKQGGRLIYVGAGTSGRIGNMDAVECPPTFSTRPDLVQAVMAGGSQAVEQAVESAEDNQQLGARDLEMRGLKAVDVVLGIAASGRTPYVIGALKHARAAGAAAIALTSNANSEMSAYADVSIEVVTGPEVITGSTRMKAATAHKLVLNMITTTAMIKMGKVYENLMVDLKVSNHKLQKRARNIVCAITGVSAAEAERILISAHYQVKPAIMMIKTGVDYVKAAALIDEAAGFVRGAIELALQEGHG